MVILVAEDHDDVQLAISNILKADGFTVLTTYDGGAALELSRCYPGTIDLLLSDADCPSWAVRNWPKHCGRTSWYQSAPDVGWRWCTRTGPHEWVTFPSEAVHCHGTAAFHQGSAGSNAAPAGKMISINALATTTILPQLADILRPPWPRKPPLRR